MQSQLRRNNRLIRRLGALGKAFAVGAVVLACSIGGTRAAAPSVVAIPGDRASLRASLPPRTVPSSSAASARATFIAPAPGAGNAELWVKQTDAGFLSVLGVLADEKSGTLWVCSSDLSSAGVSIPGQKPTQLKALDLQSGKVKARYVLPGNRTLCNDIAIGPDGSAYVTDSFQPHVLRLKPGAKEFEIWATDNRFLVKNGAGLDGIAFGGDGNLYVNLCNGNALFRIEVNKDGSAGRITELQPSKPIALCDGMRKFGNNSLLMIEGTGGLDIVTTSGNKAHIQVVKSGFRVPVSVVQVGNVGWVLEGQLGSLFEPKKNGPPRLPFRAYAVPLPRE